MPYAALYENGTLKKYPYTLLDLQQDFPETSFPSVLTDEIAVAHGAVVVTPTTFSGDTTNYNYTQTAVLNGDTWVEYWEPSPATAEEIAARQAAMVDYIGFYDALLATQCYQDIRTQAIQSIEMAFYCTEFTAAIADAKAGRPNADALQTCITNVLGLSTMDQDCRDEITALFATYHMDHLFTLPW